MLPYQKLTDAEKIKEYGSLKEWGSETINAIIGLSNGGTLSAAVDYGEIQTNINLYHGNLDMDDLKHVTNPYGVKEAFPADLRNYNIIKPKIDLLVGEESKRPFNFRVIDANPDAVSQVEKVRKELISKSIETLIMQEAYMAGNPNIDPEVMNKQVQTPEEIDKFLKMSYTDMREHMGNQALNYLIWFTDFKRKTLKGFKDYLITGSEIYYTGIVNGEPVVNVVDPRFFYCQLSPENDFIEDAQYCFYERFLTPSQIYDEYYDFLSEDDIDKIEKIKSGTGQVYIGDSGLGIPIVYQNIDKPNPFYNNRDRLVRVIHVCWQTLRKVGFLSYTDNMGQEVEEFVDESFKLTPQMKLEGYTLEWRWINEVWEGTKIGSDIYVNIRPLPNQMKSLDNPAKCKLPYTGVYRNQSTVALMKPHQYFYDILFYRLEMSIARSKDKAMVMDVAQIPRSMGIDTQKWLYYLDTLGIAFINSFEEGTGTNAGRTSQFNQFQAVDMSMARIIDQYIMLLDKVESMVGEISGVSRQRQGEISTSELVGNVERSVVQSSNITEHLFFTHNEVKRRVLSNLLDISKNAWMNGKKAQYVLDDLTKIFFSIEPSEYSEANYGIFVTNSSKDQATLETLKQLAQAALQAGGVNFKDIAEVLQSNSITDIKQKLEAADEKAHQKAMQLEQEKTKQVEMSIQDKQADRDVLIENNIRDNETKLIIANKQLEAKQNEGVEDKSQEINNKFLIDKEKNQITREKELLAHQRDKERIAHEKQYDKEELKIKAKQAAKTPTKK